MISNLCEQLWIDFDLEVEFFLRNLVGWIRYNATKDNPEQRNFHEGQYWSYNSYTEFSKLFPGFSTKTMRTIIARCIKNGLLIIGNFNKKRYDNTNWYTLSEKGWTYFPYEAAKIYSSGASGIPDSDLNTHARSGIPPARSGRPIPKKHNSLSKDNNNSNLENANEGRTRNKSDYSGSVEKGGNKCDKIVDYTDFSTRSDYHKNQTQNIAVLPNSEQNLDNSNHSRLNGAYANSVKGGKGASLEFLRELIDVYRQEFPNNPQPHARVVSTSLHKTLSSLIKRWPELDPEGKSLTPETFRRYFMALKSIAPKFSLGEYETLAGQRKKNGLETFARWNTVVKFLENQYS